MKISDRQKRNAVAQVASGQTYETVAQRYSISARQLKRWVAAAKAVTPEIDPDPVSVEVPSPEVIPPVEGTPNPVLDDLLKEEAAGGTSKEGPPTAAEVQAAQVDMGAFCVEAVGGLRAQALAMMIQWRYTPYLDPTSPEVLKYLQLGAMAQMTVRAMAPQLYPIILKHAGTWGALILALGMDTFGSLMALESLAKSKGWEAKTKDPTKAKPKPAAKIPTMEQYGESLHPQPATDNKDPLIVDAPIPEAA